MNNDHDKIPKLEFPDGLKHELDSNWLLPFSNLLPISDTVILCQLGPSRASQSVKYLWDFF